MVFIYVLQLEQGKYYIGKTNNPTFRLENHFNLNGSAWTKKYKPTKVLELIPDCDDYDEDKYTRKYMDKYGMDNVRGGSFCEINLNENNIATLNQMSNGTNNKCFVCGSEEHFAKDCKNDKIKKEIKQIDKSNEQCDCPSSYFKSHRRKKCVLNNVLSLFDDKDENNDDLIKQEKNNVEIKKVTCFRCGREGHYATTCYAKTDISGNKIEYEESANDECVWCC